VLPDRSEPLEHPELVELAEAALRDASALEVEPGELVGGEDAVVVAVEGDPSVALGQPFGEPACLDGRRPSGLPASHYRHGRTPGYGMN